MQASAYFIDTHCHLDFTDFDHDREQVIAACHRQDIQKIIVPGVSANTWQRAIDLCNQQRSCLLALGLHPVFLPQHQEQDFDTLRTLIEKHAPIAVGEIGLDFYLKALDRQQQLDYFERQTSIAKDYGLPLIVHNRKAHDECIRILARYKVSGGIIHAFNGSLQQAHKYLDLGFKLGFGGMLTYERSTKLRALVAQLPMEALVLETDAPDMTVKQFHGQRNSPEYIPYIAKTIAEIKHIPLDEVANITSRNASQVLPL